MDYTQSFDVCVSDKQLFVFAVNLQKKGECNPLVGMITPVFTELAPFLKKDHHIMILRDNPELCIDGKIPGGNTYVDNEVKIAVPEWPADEEQLKSIISHELHHLARWQTVGYGETLGKALVTEGFATWYEMEKSGWIPPWTQVSISKEIQQKAREEWDNPTYSHKNWFFEGTMGRWVGYTLGYNLVRAYLSDTIDLSKSLWTKGEEIKELL